MINLVQFIYYYTNYKYIICVRIQLNSDKNDKINFYIYVLFNLKYIYIYVCILIYIILIRYTYTVGKKQKNLKKLSTKCTQSRLFGIQVHNNVFHVSYVRILYYRLKLFLDYTLYKKKKYSFRLVFEILIICIYYYMCVGLKISMTICLQ